MKKLRIGFLSTAGIGRRNWKAVFHSGNAVVSAVASRDLQKSRRFINECQRDFAFPDPPVAFGSYEEMLASPLIDAVYIPIPTALRQPFVIEAAREGKHVLCEKPCAANSSIVAEMIAACEASRVQFMDGVMFMHSPRLPKVRAVLDDEQSVGALRRISSAFTFSAAESFFRENIRANGALEPAGCLGDLGWYSIRFALWVMKWQLPHTVTARILSASESFPEHPSAPVDFSAEMCFEGGVSCAFYCSFITGGQQWTHVSGQKGWLLLPDFVHPHNSFEPSFEVNRTIIQVEGAQKCPAGVDPAIQGHAAAQDAIMWRNFATQVLSGKLNPDWPMWALKTQKVLDACHEAAREGRPMKL